MYLPIIIGILLSLKKYKDKANKAVAWVALFFVAIALYFFYNTYFIDHPGWDAFGYFLFWLGSTAVCKNLSCIFFGTFAGKKKAIIFFILYILIVVLSAVLGFWS